MPYPGYPYGYAPLQGERLAASLGTETPPDLKETFSMGPIERPRIASSSTRPRRSSTSRRHGRRRCPSSNRRWRRTTRRWPASWLASWRCSPTRCSCRATSSTHGSIATRARCECSTTRPSPKPPQPGQLRAGAHTDYGTVTVLRADDSPGGLEVLVERSLDCGAVGAGVVDHQPRRCDGSLDERSLALDAAPGRDTADAVAATITPAVDRLLPQCQLGRRDRMHPELPRRRRVAPLRPGHRRRAPDVEVPLDPVLTGRSAAMTCPCASGNHIDARRGRGMRLPPSSSMTCRPVATP